MLVILGLTFSIPPLLRGLRLWIKYRWLNSRLEVSVLGDFILKVSWKGERPIYIYKAKLEIPRGPGLTPILYDEVELGIKLGSGDTVHIRFEKSIRAFIGSISYLRRKPYCILETSEGVAYPYLV